MVVKPLLLPLILISLPRIADSLKCHGMEFEEDGEYMNFCEIMINRSPGKDTVNRTKIEWNYNFGMDCSVSGCEHNATATRCCCNTDLCNSVSFALLERSRQNVQFSDYYMVTVVLMILTMKYLLLLMIYFWDYLSRFRAVFPKKYHIDLTFMKTTPRITHIGAAQDLAPPDTVTKPIKTTQCTAIISYGCDDTMTVMEERIPTLADQGIHENSTMEEILTAVLNIGPKEICYDAVTAIRILKAGQTQFLNESNLLKINPPIAIYADLHGQYSDVWRWFYANGWPSRTKSIFLGDYVDRGRHSTEVFLLLVLLKVNFPTNMYMLRGNHEDGNVNRHYTFFSEVEARFGKDHKKVFAAFEDTFSAMPMTALIGQKILCMHGGLTPKVPTLEAIQGIPRPTKRLLTKDDYFIGILWSDPSKVRKFKVNAARDEGGRGIGYLFGSRQINKFCRKNKLRLLVRGHQPPMHGYERFSNRLITLFSAPGYRLENGIPNLGSSLLVDAFGRLTIVRLFVSGKTVINRQKMKMNRGDKYTIVGGTTTKEKKDKKPSPSKQKKMKKKEEAKPNSAEKLSQESDT